MRSIRDVRDYWEFSRTYDQYERAAELTAALMDEGFDISTTARAALAHLDRQRATLQDRVGRLNLQALGCTTCAGRCCDKPADRYFTPIDYWLAKSSGRPPHPFTRAWQAPVRHYLLAPARLIRDALRPPRRPATPQGCAYLGDHGCTLPYADRPIKCIIYACAPMKSSLDDATRATYSRAVRGLRDISLAAFDIVKAEAGYPARHGSVRLTVLP